LATIGASSTHLLGLINDVLDMSKIEAGKFELDIAPFDLEQTIIKICSIVAEKTEEKKQHIYVEMDPTMPTGFEADELRLSQVITNLLSNAVKFTPEGGTVRLAVEQAGCQGSLCLLRITVADTGIGMTEEQVGRLFSAFEQADSSIARRFGGTGLGLAISKTIVEKMNGSIWAEAEPDKGATFCVEVEMRRAELPAAQEPAPAGLNLVALAAEPAGCTRLQAVAGSLGFGCDTTTVPGQLARLAEGAKAAGQPYDLALVDFSTPGIDRADLVSRLDAALGAGRVVAIGSFSDWSRESDAADGLGVRLFLAKPVFPSTMLQVARQAVGMAAAMPAPDTGLPDFSHVRLLLVEDIEINREIFIALLEETGLQVDTAENGQQAVALFEADPERYDLIVMDIQMPVMDGYEATRYIRGLAHGRAQTVPIIAMTANAFREDIERCLECGMNGHLTKPIDEVAVMDVIAGYTAK
ncbi:response regulator, partial [Ruminococcaceae bacterium OttesenSCG-928-A11]|nr:response regulator [Ruminococcaceae bacterium OttesenSCG-928-A11]